MAYKSKTVTPLDVARKIIDQLPLINSDLKIFCDWNEDLIISQATESTRRYQENCPLGDMDGVPIVIKDQIDVIGLTVRNGLPFPEHNPADTDAAVIERIKSNGMMIIGLVNMHQVGLTSFGTNSSKFHGDCRNPHNPDYYCGASSSGTGAAIALGIVPCGIGSDGGGSIRIPAAFCGISTIKPSAGRIPHRGYNAGTNSVLGPMCNTMVDCAKLYSILAGPDYTKASDITICQPKVTIPSHIPEDLIGTTIGVDYNWCKFRVEQKIFAQFEEKLAWLVSKGTSNLFSRVMTQF